ncbi:GNAT family N-acetyltransferase [Sorangium sp. So ce1504]|uniref:GNAT family N-acetyltransferase n=1 Tax=unclassified Sorangium TaxID=2621164 RepID=UPI003F5E94A5
MSGARSPCRITAYRPGDRDAVVHFQRLLWNGGPSLNAAYLDWKYGRNPYLDHRYLMLAWDGDELAGMVGAFGACWEANGGDRVVLPCLADAVVAPDQRGGPLFGRMLDELVARLRADGIPWLLDFGNGLAVPALLMQGWKAIGPWPLASARRGGRVVDARSWPDAEGGGLQGSRSGVSIRASRAPHPPTIAALAAEVPLPDGVRRHVRDLEYITWWNQNPLARYFYLTAEAEGAPCGYLVGHRSLDPDDHPTPTTILDCEARSDEIWLDLLEMALTHLPGSTVLLWARDISPGRRHGLGSVGFEVKEPTGQVTRDWQLPSLILRSTGVLDPSSPLAALDSPAAWDLRAVCGRSWR